MSDFEKESKKYMSGANAEKIRAISSSVDNKKIGSSVDQAELKKAVKSGDSKTLERIVAQVLATSEGKKLAKSITDIMGKK